MTIDSGMDSESIAGAEAFWANLPTGRKWASLKTHEKALVCHQMDRLKALFRKHDPSALVIALRRIADTEASLRPGHIAYLSKEAMICMAINALAAWEASQ